jgi:hypothetical protein
MSTGFVLLVEVVDPTIAMMIGSVLFTSISHWKTWSPLSNAVRA